MENIVEKIITLVIGAILGVAAQAAYGWYMRRFHPAHDRTISDLAAIAKQVSDVQTNILAMQRNLWILLAIAIAILGVLVRLLP